MLPRKIPKPAKRASRWRSQAHLAFVRSLHCARDGCAGLPIEAAHVRIGSGAGMGQKPDDWRTVGLCKWHHARQHTMGEPSFWAEYTASGQGTVDDLIAEYNAASPRRAQIAAEMRERGL